MKRVSTTCQPDSAVSGQRRVLLLDDDADVRAAFREVLELEGFAVTEAGRADDALPLLHCSSFDALAIDLAASDAQGEGLIAQLRAEHGQALLRRTIVISGRLGLGSDFAVRWGLAKILVKPIHLNALVDAVRGVCAAQGPNPLGS